MTIKFAVLLLAVLCVSLPSVVFSQPLDMTLPGATSKSWEGPFFGLGLGLGLAKASGNTPLVGVLPVRVRLGYGIAPNTLLYGSVFTLRALGASGEWVDPAGVLGVMFPGGRDNRNYGFSALGTSFRSSPRLYYLMAGYGIEVHPGLSVEGACTLESYGEGQGLSGVVLDLTFNYHFY